MHKVQVAKIMDIKNWNGFWWNPDGADCWCNERENVTNECSSEDDDPGESG